tara:strand:- start:1198 stop:2154 length:957 start_codon:yes stop_codon:yes gene_type:complete
MLSQITAEPGEGEAMPIPNSVSPRTNNVPDVSPPSIGSSAMLSELAISQWTARKKDRKASKDVTDSNNAESGVANVNKKLLGSCAELDRVHKMTGEVRRVHYAMTMPWSDAGLRLLPTVQYFNYHKAMTDIENQWRALVGKFLSSYQWEISKAQAKLGDLFDVNEYPTTDALVGKFAFNLNYIPLPDAGDFRIDVGNDAVDEVKTSYDNYYSRQLENAMNDVWTRLHTALSNMSERLDYHDSNKKVFRDRLVDNVTDMIGLLDVCNVTGDSHMTALKNKLEDTMYGISADVLRESTDTRIETKRAVDQIISELPGIEI